MLLCAALLALAASTLARVVASRYQLLPQTEAYNEEENKIEPMEVERADKSLEHKDKDAGAAAGVSTKDAQSQRRLRWWMAGAVAVAALVWAGSYQVRRRLSCESCRPDVAALRACAVRQNARVVRVLWRAHCHAAGCVSRLRVAKPDKTRQSDVACVGQVQVLRRDQQERVPVYRVPAGQYSNLLCGLGTGVAAASLLGLIGRVRTG
eukprot:3857864-Rhodomonas_salina.1